MIDAMLSCRLFFIPKNNLRSNLFVLNFALVELKMLALKC